MNADELSVFDGVVADWSESVLKERLSSVVFSEWSANPVISIPAVNAAPSSTMMAEEFVPAMRCWDATLNE